MALFKKAIVLVLLAMLAAGAFTLGYLANDKELKEKAFKICRKLRWTCLGK